MSDTGNSSLLRARRLRKDYGKATALTLGLALRGVTSNPYEATRTAAAGPDVVADVPVSNGGPPAAFTALVHAPGVVGHSGPYLIAFPVLQAGGHTDPAMVEGRDTAAAPVDQPKLTEGSWVRNGGW